MLPRSDPSSSVARRFEQRSLSDALRTTAARLREGAPYEWGHVGRCNCGHLVQTLTDLDSAKILRSFRHDLSEWSEIARDYCSVTGREVDELFQVLFRHGMSLDDIRHLERLSDPAVLHRIPRSRRHELRRNVRADVIVYLGAFADLVDERPSALQPN